MEQTPTIDLTLFWWSFVGYSVALLLYIAYLAFENNKLSLAATAGMGAAFILQTTAMIIRINMVGHLPLTNMFEYVGTFAWFAAVFYFVALKIYKQQIIGAFISPVIFMLMVSASLLPKNPNLQLVPALQSYWLKIHVSLTVIGEAAFVTAFAANIMFFVKKLIPSNSGFAKRFPSYDRLDYISYKAITVGYPLFTIGALFAGAIWAEQAWGSFWSWDPKEVSSLVVWLIYTLYFHARYIQGWKGGRAAVISMIGFISTIATIFSNMILGGLHSY